MRYCWAANVSSVTIVTDAPICSSGISSFVAVTTSGSARCGTAGCAGGWASAGVPAITSHATTTAVRHVLVIATLLLRERVLPSFGPRSVS